MLPPEIAIRRGVPEDAPIIARLVVALIDEICERSGAARLDINVLETTDTCRDLIANGHYLALLAFAGDEAVGVATVAQGYALYAGGPMATIEEFYVTPEWRSRQVGASLIERIRELGLRSGWRAVELCTPPLPAFDKTVAFYENCGFAISGGRKMRTWLNAG